jgi:hypothetical protein
MSTPVRGSRVDFQRNPNGTLITGDFRPLLRAVSKEVASWQITLSPVFKIPIGPDNRGVPVVATETGSPRFRLTFGAGGVTWRYESFYPVAGGAFTVSADFVTLEVFANDGVTVFTADNTPAVVGWITERAQPQTPTPLCEGVMDAALLGPFTVSPWTRALQVFAGTAGATVTVTITGATGVMTMTVASGTRIEWPAQGLRWSAVASAGNASAVEEISFA